ncbi:unnamed protein product [Ilex paraguariensis]|uniref:Uncharacterized protein n=1 Tax=Ilex paraguariensis TaxID=185542 RepID=A0ABC8RI81_9AQUA
MDTPPRPPSNPKPTFSTSNPNPQISVGRNTPTLPTFPANRDPLSTLPPLKSPEPSSSISPLHYPDTISSNIHKPAPVINLQSDTPLAEFVTQACLVAAGAKVRLGRNGFHSLMGQTEEWSLEKESSHSRPITETSVKGHGDSPSTIDITCGSVVLESIVRELQEGCSPFCHLLRGRRDSASLEQHTVTEPSMVVQSLVCPDVPSLAVTEAPHPSENVSSGRPPTPSVSIQIERILDSCMARVFQRLSLKRQLHEEKMEGRPMKVTRRDDGLLMVSTSNLNRDSSELGGPSQALECPSQAAPDTHATAVKTVAESEEKVIRATSGSRRVRKFVSKHAIQKQLTTGDVQLHEVSIQWIEDQTEMAEEASLTMSPHPLHEDYCMELSRIGEFLDSSSSTGPLCPPKTQYSLP